MDNQYYTVKDIQKILRISKDSAYRLVRERYIPSLKIGRTYRISKEVFEKWLTQN